MKQLRQGKTRGLILLENTPNPCTLPNPISPPQPIHDLFLPGAYRDWLQAADVSSSVFIVPINIGGGGNHVKTVSSVPAKSPRSALYPSGETPARPAQ